MAMTYSLYVRFFCSAALDPSGPSEVHPINAGMSIGAATEQMAKMRALVGLPLEYFIQAD